jgi:maltooligosyltrehalose trehalohydrolase
MPGTSLSPSRPWRPRFGAHFTSAGLEVRVWAPTSTTVSIRLTTAGGVREVSLRAEAEGCFAGSIDRVRPGDRYAVVSDTVGLVPDPASRSQPDGVDGLSEVVDPATYTWRTNAWDVPGLDDLVIYELHVGCFTPEGTFAAAASRLPHLAALGVTAVELMPVAAFPGRRNWGYDGAALFAPAAVYGRPDDLRALVDAAHALDLAVILDVVFNHFGPAGAYAAALSPLFFSAEHTSPWGAGINLDGPGSEMVRAFFIDNALHWLREYRFDGLRLDATHALIDESERHFVAELTACVRALVGRPVLMMAEDHRNLRTLVEAPSAGGWGLDAVWADDFHHVVRRLTAGDDEGYFADFAGTPQELAQTLNRGWLFQGEYATSFMAPRGTPAHGLPRARSIVCLQNHDQIGNRAEGDRLHHVIDPAAFRALSVLVLLAPETPLLFMGQEWAAATPFQYFTDHDEALGALVREGRRHEFQRFRAFADETRRAQIPDPQATSTFLASQLRWAERDDPPHAGVLALYRDTLRLRRGLAPGGAAGDPEMAWPAEGTAGIVLRRAGKDGSLVVLAACLKGAGDIDVSKACPLANAWRIALTTESAHYVDRPEPPRVTVNEAGAVSRVQFSRPGAVVFVMTSE